MSKVRVRFAPSPTGPLHLGGVRTIMSDENFDRVNDFFNLRTNNKYVFFLQWRTFKEALQTLENNELKLKTI